MSKYIHIFSTFIITKTTIMTSPFIAIRKYAKYHKCYILSERKFCVKQLCGLAPSTYFKQKVNGMSV